MINTFGYIPGQLDTAKMALNAANTQTPLGRAAAQDMVYNNAITQMQQDKIGALTDTGVAKTLSLDPNAMNRLM